ncbi:MAG: Fic family protein [Endomicrobium sp.]|jgi:Fic family protein|nr:Fic family protein [Endomicrobium sp.]
MRPFVPQKLPVKNLNWERLSFLISKANSSLSKYSGLLDALLNPEILLAPITTQEAVLSSKIEGTQATFSEVYKLEAGAEQDKAKENDINEIINYRKAITASLEMLERRQFIHLNMLKELHKVLLSGVRGENRARGEFRKIQNFIGPYGCDQEMAVYVPPIPENVQDCLGDWERYVNNDEQEVLVQLAVMHAQFEIIHPFIDGNGRTGRILIPIFLLQKGYLKKPAFYLSEYLEANRGAYYEALRNISKSNDWQGWVEFFLKAIAEQSERGKLKAEKILNLYEDMKKNFYDAAKSRYYINILDTFFKKPIINLTTLLSDSGIFNRKTATQILDKLAKKGYVEILKKGSGSSPTIFAFPALINIIENKEESVF